MGCAVRTRVASRRIASATGTPAITRGRLTVLYGDRDGTSSRTRVRRGTGALCSPHPDDAQGGEWTLNATRNRKDADWSSRDGDRPRVLRLGIWADRRGVDDGLRSTQLVRRRCGRVLPGIRRQRWGGLGGWGFTMPSFGGGIFFPPLATSVALRSPAPPSPC